MTSLYLAESVSGIAGTADVIFWVMQADQVTQTIWSGDNGGNYSRLFLATNKSTVLCLRGLRGTERFLNCEVKDK